MKDHDFVAAFEACTLPNEAFHHRDHVRLAWLYLKDMPPAAALARFTEGLRRFAEAHGKPGLYHETITWAYLLLIRERMARAAEGETGETFEEFAEANPDLLTWKPSILASYYRAETLGSELARRVFVLPDAQLEPLERLVAAGRVVPARLDLAALGSPPPLSQEGSISEALAEQRREGREPEG